MFFCKAIIPALRLKHRNAISLLRRLVASLSSAHRRSQVCANLQPARVLKRMRGFDRYLSQVVDVLIHLCDAWAVIDWQSFRIASCIVARSEGNQDGKVLTIKNKLKEGSHARTRTCVCVCDVYVYMYERYIYIYIYSIGRDPMGETMKRKP